MGDGSRPSNGAYKVDSAWTAYANWRSSAVDDSFAEYSHKERHETSTFGYIDGIRARAFCPGKCGPPQAFGGGAGPREFARTAP